MQKFTKAVAVIMLLMAIIIVAGCTKDPNNNNDNNDNNSAIVIPMVETSPVREITETKALGGGVVTSDGGGSIIERGVCWSTQTNPIVSGDHALAGMGVGSFTCEIIDLEPNTTYYVRAYAINGTGVGYGNEVSFTTLSGNGGSIIAPDGAVNGVYSVSASQKVFFSKGNLQYQASTEIWRFALNQYDYIGNDNINISSSYDGWIDLFGWGTSGYNGSFPYLNSVNDEDYGNGNNSISGTNYDWGVFNSISNGGNSSGLWRTLTKTEWTYLLASRRTSSGIRFAKGQVNGVNGVILLPDNWEVSFAALNNINQGSASFTSNVVNESVWKTVFESAGAVFLPAAGNRSPYITTLIPYVGNRGRYWSASIIDGDATNDAWCLDFGSDYFDWFGGRSMGFSVRLICQAE